MNRLLALVFCLALAPFAPACGGESSSSDPAAGSDDALSKPLPFTDEASVRHVVLDGMKVDLYDAPKALSDGVFKPMESGYGFGGFTARLASSDLASIKSDPKKVARLAEQMSFSPSPLASGEPTPADHVTVDLVTAADARSEFGKDVGNTRLLGIAVKSLLALPTEAIYIAAYDIDWTDYALIAITTSGEVRTIHAWGDI